MALIPALDAGTYDILGNTVYPKKPVELDYAELAKAPQEHFNTTPITVGERFKFWKRNQRDGELVKDYALELRKLSRTCEFGQFLDEGLRDRLVWGLRSERYQKRLLSEPKLDFSPALNLAQALEQAASQAASFHGYSDHGDVRPDLGAPGSAEAPVNRVFSTAKGPVRKPGKCWRFGRAGHFPSTCHFREASCHRCGKVGHIKPVCSFSSVLPG